jgi:hypothetical protein
MNKPSLDVVRAEYRAMIEVRSPLEIEADNKGGWELLFWVCDSFNYTTPFRGMLSNIADALGQDSQVDLQLPAYKVGEDFIEGTLQFGPGQLRIYYEYSLSYLALMSHDKAVLCEIADRLQPHITVTT